MLLWIYTLIDIVYFMSEYNELFGKYYQEAEKYLQNMNLEERIGQMFFVKYTENASQEISKKKFGGFVLYANFFNREDNLIQNDMNNIQNLSRKAVNLPLGLAVDEEGGFVNRVSLYKREEGIFPSSKDIYKSSGIEGVLIIEEEKRNLLRKYRLNINLAPVADISYL